MNTYKSFSVLLILFIAMGALPSSCLAVSAVSLPSDVKAVWELAKAERETTPTRERICINGLWRWQPVKKSSAHVPTSNWGYIKVPAPWPGTSHWMHRESQTHYPHPSWKHEELSKLYMAWYQREIEIPKTWASRRISVYMEYLNSYAAVFVDGNKMGEIFFPGGQVDITSACRPESKHMLSIYVKAMPLNKVITRSAAADGTTSSKASVKRRGLCGDVFLISTPAQSRIDDVKVDTSVRTWKIAFDTALSGLEKGELYSLHVEITDSKRTLHDFSSGSFTEADLKNGRFVFASNWRPSKLWDIHTPQYVYHAAMSLLDSEGNVVDVFQPVRFGFREFWIDGRDFFLNGSRIFCFAVPLDNAQIGAAWASYEGSRETLLRLKSIGVNLVYTHNYGCAPGSHLSFNEILRAADDVGMLISLSMPHARSYTWNESGAEDTNGYARHAEFYVRMAQNHPSVVMYSLNHNMMGYAHDMNPDFIDGLRNTFGEQRPRRDKRAILARATEGILKRFDKRRVIYHHSSGNCGQMYTSNFYLNFVPIQERSDWFEHWASEGVKPLFLCEYGVPLGMSWTLHRGWEQGKCWKTKRHYTNGKLQYQFCTAEWGSQFLGDGAYHLTDEEKQNIRFEAEMWRAGKTWYRWDYPFRIHASPLGIPNLDDVQSMYISDNWRAYRTWGVSAFNLWSYGNLWKLKKGIDEGRKTFKVDWEHLQKPGFSPDYIDRPYKRIDTAYEVSDWIPTNAGKAFLRNNQPLLAYIGGKPGRFTSKDHNFYAGRTVEKQLIIINNSRERVICNCSWSLDLPEAVSGSAKVKVETGEQERIPLKLFLPETLEPGEYTVTMKARFGSGDTQHDSFEIQVMPAAPSLQLRGKIALFDPRGETSQALNKLGINYELVGANADLSSFTTLIIGKEALGIDTAALNIDRVREGLKVLVFEQNSEVLEKRFGFRVQEYGLRRVFKRIPDHPALKGVTETHLRNWRGQSSIVPPRLEYEFRPKYYPTVRWCGMNVTRAWRCGNYGNVASVLIEKPTQGDFLPILDGGFNMQYSPLVEYREGDGIIIFCQMDVTGRTERDPAAVQLVVNLLKYVDSYSSMPNRNALYVGDPAGWEYFQEAGVSIDPYEGGEINSDQILFVGPCGTKELAAHKAEITAWLQNGGNLLAIGLNEQKATAFLPFEVKMNMGEHIDAYFPPFGMKTLLAGIGPAEVCIRDPRDIPRLSEGAIPVGNGVLAFTKDSKVVFCQLVPWQFDYRDTYHGKMTFRRTAFLVSRLLSNMGVKTATPLISRFSNPLEDHWYRQTQERWLKGLYLDRPIEMDDPYRFFRW